MFREMRRFKQQVSEDECLRILNEGKRGVLAVLGDDEYPYVMHQINSSTYRTFASN